MTDIERLFGGTRKPTDFKDSESPDVKSVSRPSGVRVAVRRPPGKDPLPPIGRNVERPATLPLGREVVRLPPAQEAGSVPLIRSSAERDRAAAKRSYSGPVNAEPPIVASSTVESSSIEALTGGLPAIQFSAVDPSTAESTAAQPRAIDLPGAAVARIAVAPEPEAQSTVADPRDKRVAAQRYLPLRMLWRHSHYSVLLAVDSSLHREVVVVMANRCLPSFASALLQSMPERGGGAAKDASDATAARRQLQATTVTGSAARDHAASPDDPQMLAAAFRRHVAVAAGLRHPNIVATLDLVRTDGTAFLVFERVQGRSLRALLAGDWRPTLTDALGLAVALADALRYAHGLGVAHGALGPEHMFVGADGVLKIAGFGGWTDIGADAPPAPLAGSLSAAAETSAAGAPTADRVVATATTSDAPAAPSSATAETAAIPAQAGGAADFFASTGHAAEPDPMVPPESLQPDEWRRADLRVLADVFELLVRRAQVSARAGTALTGDDPAATAPLLNLPQDVAELARRTRADDRDADPAAARGNAVAARVAVGRSALAPPPDAAQWHACLTLLWLQERAAPWPGARLHPLAPAPMTVTPDAMTVTSDAMDPTAALAALVAAAPSPRGGFVAGPSARGLSVAGPALHERSMAPPSRASGAGAGPAPVRLRSFPWRWVASGALAAGLVTAALFGTSRTSFVPAGSRDLTATALPEAAGGVTPEAAAGGSASVPVDGRSGAAPTVRVAPPASGFAATTLERDAAAVAALAGASPVVAGMRVTPDLPQGASSTALAAAVGPRTDGATAAGANGGAGGAVVPGAAGGVSDARPAHGALALAMPGNTPSAGGAVRARPARPPARSANGDTGQLRLGISPWGEVYVDGALRGVTPPLDRLALAPGTYAVEIRNAGAVSLRRTLVIHPGESVSISHQF